MTQSHRILRFAKGHGTGNDFVLLLDLEDRIDLTAALVSSLCDRRFGIGADGLLRVVPTHLAAEVAVSELAHHAEFFMDYWNADGSKAEMCGNGVRVFAHYLFHHGLVQGDSVSVATRGGVRQVRRVVRDGVELFSVEMGRAAALGEVEVSTNGRRWSATAVELPNPHAVAFVDTLSEAGDLVEQPTAAPASVFPNGANFEFVEVTGERSVAMVVHERGVGRTLSCGTGACAVAWAARRLAGVPAGEDTEWQVAVPGGLLWIAEDAAGELTLTGPAVLVAEGAVDSKWLAEISS